MGKTIVQKVVFNNTTPKVLYDYYMNEAKHSQLTGGTAKIKETEGSIYSVHNNYITGKNLQLIKDVLIVQSWRASDWSKVDIDSTLSLHFVSKGKNTVLHVTHANVPKKNYSGIKKGWHQYYWEPWQASLSKNTIVKAKTQKELVPTKSLSVAKKSVPAKRAVIAKKRSVAKKVAKR